MKIAEILKEQGPQAPIKPIGSTIGAGTVKRKTPVNPFGANKQLQNLGNKMVKQANTAYQGRQEGGKYTPDAGPEENWNSAAGKTIKTGTIDSNLEQSGKDYAQDLQRKLNKTQQPKAKPTKQNVIQDISNR